MQDAGLFCLPKTKPEAYDVSEEVMVDPSSEGRSGQELKLDWGE